MIELSIVSCEKDERKLHPDNGSSAESSDRFVELKMAYDVLRRPDERRAEWSRSRAQNSSTSESFADAEHRKRSNEQWRFILKWTAAGFVLAVMYNIAYVLQLHARDRRLFKPVDEHEIAKSFMRQPEFRDRFPDTLEIHELGRILKGDVVEAWRRKQESLGGKNPNEI
ncbi:hypothetical protein KIN20_029543 [Parelaphostrongylus tenuis]|uniref:J domain-containing protein n=1 Tax=Parelaphostrongylus tenuis TaxID=148309 RepID=A0AAD5R2M8_PARTN|nr:hypothetical protein KIN20_029543 [Parelaphostrongylus tenuis]